METIGGRGKLRSPFPGFQRRVITGCMPHDDAKRVKIRHRLFDWQLPLTRPACFRLLGSSVAGRTGNTQSWRETTRSSRLKRRARIIRISPILKWLRLHLLKMIEECFRCGMRGRTGRFEIHYVLGSQRSDDAAHREAVQHGLTSVALLDMRFDRDALVLAQLFCQQPATSLACWATSHVPSPGRRAGLG
jgi:hypothetical protein